MIRLGIVVPRYGPEVLGGAETFARHFAEHLPADEFEVTVLTTCARDLLTWRNEYPPGEMRINGLRVLRFPVDHQRRDARLFGHLTDRINRGEPTTVDEQAAWLEHSAHSPELYVHLDRHGAGYDLFIFLPYLSGVTLYGSSLWPEKSVVWPCLHDEPYAYFVDVRLMLNSVRGLMFTSVPEQDLARRRLGVYGPGARLVGFGLDEASVNANRFRQAFELPEPFVLYAGRLDPAKNVLELISHFLAHRQTRPDRDLKLVLAGSGPLPLPDHADVVPLGQLAPADLHDACAAALVLCQPSLVESFSIVLMEAWLAGTPVLAHGQCDVTRYHVVQSNGGLYFNSGAEFTAALDWYFDNPQACQRLGAQGKAYVRREYNWPTVLGRFREGLEVWLA
jgi:glycosyltransferase involved in cell wall biosynthesis